MLAGVLQSNCVAKHQAYTESGTRTGGCVGTEGILLVMLAIQAACLVLLAVALLRRSNNESRSALLYSQLLQVAQRDQAAAIRMAEQLEGLAPMSQNLGALQNTVARVQGALDARQRLDEQSGESIRRLESLLTGSQSRGAAFESVVSLALAQLPPEWVVRNWRTGNKVVEFALRMPNGKVVPIDCKWSGAALVEQLEETTDPAEARRLRQALVNAVSIRVRQIAKYVDPAATQSFAIAVVPDAVYQVLAQEGALAGGEHLVVIGASLLVPYLLLTFHTLMMSAQDVDLERLNVGLQASLGDVASLQEQVQGRISRAIIMLENARNEMSTRLGAMQATLAGTRRTAYDVLLREGDEEVSECQSG